MNPGQVQQTANEFIRSQSDKTFGPAQVVNREFLEDVAQGKTLLKDGGPRRGGKSGQRDPDRAKFHRRFGFIEHQNHLAKILVSLLLAADQPQMKADEYFREVVL